METKELLKKVKKIEIKTKGLSKNIFAGEYHSAFKGRGMAFSEVRSYQPGDDVRALDWKVTARFNEPFIKVFEEERELTIMLLIDVSASESFGTKNQFKKDLITEILATISFSAIQNNDKIGVIFFSNQIELFIPPKKGKKHVLRVIREAIELEPKSKKTDLSLALKYFNDTIKKHATAFIISDFIASNYENQLRVARKKHDLLALKVYDKGENSLPNVGLIQLKDNESGTTKWVNSSSRKVRESYKQIMLENEEKSKDLIRKCGVKYTKIATDEDYVRPLINLFKNK